jgi:hypothetical protein
MIANAVTYLVNSSQTKRQNKYYYNLKFLDNTEVYTESENVVVSKLITGETANFAHIGSKGLCGPNCGKKTAGILTDKL